MKEILFKAKRKGREDGSDYISPYKNGDWVFGLVSKQYKGHWADEFDDEMTDENGVSGITIDRDTICEYTGVKDKRGVKIFEGDIVLGQEDNEEYVVVYLNGSFECFSLKTYGRIKEVFIRKFITLGNAKSVVDNIYDRGGTVTVVDTIL